ncbi:nucleotide-binding alpha-beta plait domain-containing protein [Tanacetum coccineum]
MKEIGRSSRIDDEVFQDQRQRDDNDLQDERQDQPKEEEVEPRSCKRERTKKSFRPNFVSFMVENEPTSYQEACLSSASTPFCAMSFSKARFRNEKHSISSMWTSSMKRTPGMIYAFPSSRHSASFVSICSLTSPHISTVSPVKRARNPSAATTLPRSIQSVALVLPSDPIINQIYRSTPHHLAFAATGRRHQKTKKRRNITMVMISAFTIVDKTSHNSHKFAFTLSRINYGYWKTMIEPFLITNNLMGYVDGSIPCPSKTLFVTDDAKVPKENPNYPIWISKDADVRMLIISTISEASFHHVQGTTSCDLWLSLEKVYAPHSTSKEHTLKTQILRINMHGDETPDSYLNHAQEYTDSSAAIGEPVKDKYLVMLVVSGLHEEYNGLKTTITARQNPTAFSELHALLSDHDYMFGKTHAPALSITSSFAANYAVGSPSMLETHQDKLSELTPQLSALGFQVSPITTSGPQAFYGVHPSNNNKNNNNNNCGNRNNSRGNNNNRGHETGANSHVTPDLEAMDNSKAYYGDDALHVGNVSHLSQTSQTSLESSNSQPSPVSTTSIPTPPLPTPPPPPPPPPPITRKRPWRQAMKEEYDALMKNGTWSLVPCASNTNVVDGIDFQETFWPVAKSSTIRAVLSLTVTNNWPICQLDIQNAFLHGNHKEQVYMKQPLSFIDPQQPNHPCLLHKSLYGLKQALRAWFERLSKALFDLGFKVSKMDPSLFIYSRGDTLLYILVCQYIHAPTKIHWSTVKRILRYLHGTVEHGMLIRRSTSSTLQAFTDVLWKEVEYKALADTVAELTLLQALLNELGIRSSLTPILWCDNLGATYLSANPIFHAHTKHVQIDYHFVREKVSQGDL